MRKNFNAQIVKWFRGTSIAAVLFLTATSTAGESIVFPASGLLGDPSSRFGPNAPSMPNSFFPYTSTSGNTVSVLSGSVGGHVFGGIAANSGASAIDNIVNITGGTIGTSTTGGHVFGGWSYDRGVIGNSVEITGGSTLVRGIVFGGWLNGGTGSNVEQNSVTIGSGATVRDNIYGGYSQGQGIVRGNEITINGGSVTKSDAIIAGGYSALSVNTVSDNSVTINDGVINNARIYGGRGQAGSLITGNTININGGTIANGSIFGGQNINSGAVNLNRVNITNGSVNATVYGGHSSGGSAVTGNTVSISGGSVTGNIYGGYSTSGSATDNTVTIGGSASLGSGFNLFGGYVNSGSGDAFTGNVLNKNNAAMIDTARNFQFVNFGYSGSANIGVLTTTPTGSGLPGVILDTAANDVNFGGVINGTGNLTKTGAGTLILTGANTYSGGTEIENGTISILNGDSLNRAIGASPGTRVGYVTFTGTAGTKKVILGNIDPAGVLLTNSFRTQTGAGSNNYVDLTSSSRVVMISDIEIADAGGAFYVATGTTMNVAANNLFLFNNQANSQLNDLYVEFGGTFNLEVNSTDWNDPSMAVFASGVNGGGTLNISTNGPASVTFLSDFGSTFGTFQMGTTNVVGSAGNISVLFLERIDSVVSPRLYFENTGNFNVMGDRTPVSAALIGDGVVKANEIHITNGAALAPTDKGAAGTLTLDASKVNLSDFVLLYKVNPTPTRAQDPLDTITDPGLIPFSNNDLLNIDSDDVTLTNGTVYFRTADGASFMNGEYLVIRSKNGFINISNDVELNHQLSTIMVDGFELNSSVGSPRGAYGFELGGDPNTSSGGRTPGDENIWFGHALNSLSMAWTGDVGTEAAPIGGDWTSGEFFYSLQVDGGQHERRFLTGDKVYISGTGSFRIDLPGGDDPFDFTSQKIVVSGLVVGQSMGGADTNGGTYTISGDGGITADAVSAFGIYLSSLSSTPDNERTTGKLQKYGDSTLTFTNTGGNLFKEGIELYGGVVAFTRADQLGDGGGGIRFSGDSMLRALNSVTLDNDVDIADGTIGSLDAASGAVFAYTGELTGSNLSTLNKVGTGVVRLGTSGVASTFEGIVIVSSGTLDIAGDYGSTAQFNVKNGGTLSGTGIIGAMSGRGIIESGGTLKPGGLDNNPLEVAGDLAFETGSNFDVRVQFGGGNDLVEVTHSGIVSIEPAVNLNVEVDYWSHPSGGSPSDRHTIIDAADGVVGDVDDRFVLHTFGLPRGWRLGQGWNGEEFQLWFDGYDPNNGFGAVGFTHNQTEIGKTLDWFVVNRDPGIRHLIDRLSDSSWSDREVARQLDQLHGDLTPNALFMALKEPWRHPFDRLRPGAASHSAYAHDGAWAEFVSRHERIDHDGNAHGSTINRNGIAIGVNHPLSSRSVIGMTFQYTQSRLRQDTGTAKADDYEFGLYNMTRLSDNLDLKAYLGYSRQRYDFRRTVSLPASPSGRYEAFYERLNGSASGHALAASVELIRPVQVRRNIRLLPVAALDFEKARINGYRESAGQASLDYDAASMKRMMLRFGVDSELDLQNGFYLKPRVQYAAQVNGQKHPSVDARFANSTLPGQRAADIWGSEIGRNYLNLGLGGGLKTDGRGDKVLYMNYDAKLYSRATSHAGMVGFMMKW